MKGEKKTNIILGSGEGEQERGKSVKESYTQ